MEGRGIAGELGCWMEGDFGWEMEFFVGYFSKQGEYWVRVEGAKVLQGNWVVIVCRENLICSLHLEKYEDL